LRRLHHPVGRQSRQPLQAEGKEIETIEGLGTPDRLHPLQKSFIQHGAVQCGFCTPGMLMSAVALLRKNSNPSAEEIKRGISGNLCRCTGYAKIVRAIQNVSDLQEERGHATGD